MLIGEAYVSKGANAAHVNTVIGERDGPVGIAWATALSSPSAGHAPFVAVAQPGVAVTPPTLIVNKAAIADTAHATMTYGPAQLGVATGVAAALEEGAIEVDRLAELVLIAAVYVNPAADDAGAIFANNRAATLQALRNGREQRPTLEEFLAAASSPWNRFFTPG